MTVLLDCSLAIQAKGNCHQAGHCHCNVCPNHPGQINSTGHCNKHFGGCHVMCQPS